MTTNNHPAHGPVSLDRLHQIREHLQHDTQYSNGGNRAYILADVLKVIDVAIAAFGAEPVAWMIIDIDTGEKIIRPDRSYFEGPCQPLYAAQSASVVPDEKPMPEASKMYAIDAVAAIAEVRGWNACRAAMLQVGNSSSKCSLRDGIEAIRNSGIPVDVDKIKSECEAANHTEQHLDMVDHFGDANEKVDCRLPFDQWLSQQNEPIDVDCGCVTTEAFYHWLRVAYEAGNYPVTPDTWIPVSERMPPQGVPLLVCSGNGVVQRTVYGFDGENWLDWYEQYDPVKAEMGDLWQPLPAAPQQEVKHG